MLLLRIIGVLSFITVAVAAAMFLYTRDRLRVASRVSASFSGDSPRVAAVCKSTDRDRASSGARACFP